MGVVTLRARRIPAVWDVATNYDEDTDEFEARSDIDHKVYISDRLAVYANPDTGEIKVAKK